MFPLPKLVPEVPREEDELPNPRSRTELDGEDREANWIFWLEDEDVEFSSTPWLDQSFSKLKR